jgi:putative membrane protein
MVEGSLLTIGLFCWLFLRAAREGEERQELLDLAAERGVALDERRAARAVAAGRGEDLRRRIETTS